MSEIFRGCKAMAELLPEIPDLVQCLQALLAQVPAGRVTTYGTLAEALGNPIAARWVGYFALHHDHTAGCRCHRIVRADGGLGKFIGGSERAKARLLTAEGVRVAGSAVDLAKFGHDRFVTGRPLEELKRAQESLVKRVSLRPRKRIPKLVAGVDVSYPTASEGIAAYALVETKTGRLVWSKAIRRPVAFPYITTYLSFRELPLLLDLIEEVRTAGKMAEVLLVDGSGVLHHRHAGIAAHLGVAASLPTIGVTKKLLCGKVNIEGMRPRESRPVLLGEEPAGVAIRTSEGSRRPIFISPGHRLDLAYSECLVRQLLIGRRLPEPLYWADRLSRTGAAE